MENMKNSIAFSFFILSFYFSALAQSGTMYVPKPITLKNVSAEVGVFLGGSYYTGDLNPSGHFNRFTRPAAGGVYRFNFNPRMSAKAMGAIGMIEGDDSYSKNDSRRNRNLSFKSNLYELALEGEFNFLSYTTGNKKLSLVTPYIFAGVAVYHFEPMGLYQGRWYSLQRLGTEGQGTSFSSTKTYSLTQFSLPFGVGLKVNSANRVGITFEWGLRKTFTDYLDDVSGKYVDPALLASEKGAVAATLSDKSLTQEGGSNIGRQRGNPYTKDWYSFAGIIITFKLKGNEGRCDVPH